MTTTYLFLLLPLLETGCAGLRTDVIKDSKVINDHGGFITHVNTTETYPCPDISSMDVSNTSVPCNGTAAPNNINGSMHHDHGTADQLHALPDKTPKVRPAQAESERPTLSTEQNTFNGTKKTTETPKTVSLPKSSEQNALNMTKYSIQVPQTVSPQVPRQPVTTNASRNDSDQIQKDCPSPEVSQQGDTSGSGLGLTVGLPVAGLVVVLCCLVLACRLRKQLNRDESVFYTNMRMQASSRRRLCHGMAPTSSASPGLPRRGCSRC